MLRDEVAIVFKCLHTQKCIEEFLYVDFPQYIIKYIFFLL